MAEKRRARVIRVRVDRHGGTLATPAAVGDQVLEVKDAGDFAVGDLEAGTLLVDDAVTLLDYTDVTFVEDTDPTDLTSPDTITLAAPLTVAIAANTSLWVYETPDDDPDDDGIVADYIALCIPEDEEDAVVTGNQLRATIPPDKQDDLPVGRQDGRGVPVVLEYDDDTDEWTVLRFRGKARGLRFEHAEPAYTPTDDELTAGVFTRQLLHRNIADDVALFTTINGNAIGSEWWTLDAVAGAVTVTIPDWVADAPADRRSFGWPMYAYRRGLASTTSLLNIPLGYSWKYKTGLGGVSTPAGVAYDDSTWATGPSPFGWGTSVGTLVPSPMDVWTRIHVTTSGGDLTFATPTGVDNYSEVYLDGNPIWSPTYPSIGASITVPCAAGAHVIAIHGEGDGISQDRIGFTVTEAA